MEFNRLMYGILLYTPSLYMRKLGHYHGPSLPNTEAFALLAVHPGHLSGVTVQLPPENNLSRLCRKRSNLSLFLILTSVKLCIALNLFLTVFSVEQIQEVKNTRTRAVSFRANGREGERPRGEMCGCLTPSPSKWRLWWVLAGGEIIGGEVCPEVKRNDNSGW